MENTPSVTTTMFRAVRPGFFQARFKLGHVVVGIAVPGRLAQAHAVDDGRVVQAVADDGVFLGQQGLKHPAIGVECRGVEDGVFGVMESPQYALFQFLVDVLRATDEANAGHAKSMGVDGFFGRFNDPRM